jgi:hypothetical protein
LQRQMWIRDVANYNLLEYLKNSGML